MSQLRISVTNRNLSFDASRGKDISIPLYFNHSQPNHFNANTAQERPLQSESFLGDTKQGGSCNVSVITFTPHSNGTHTECISHVTAHGPGIRDIAPTELQIAALVTVTPIPASQSSDRYDPKPDTKDLMITKENLAVSLDSLTDHRPSALVVRTRPNTDAKLVRNYEQEPPPYFSLDAVDYLVETGIDHLLVDIPSLDRSHDEGKLNGHRIFWGLPPGSRNDLEAQRPWATITEMIYVNNEINDGIYLLNLQVPAFSSDAAPSRPILYPREN